MYCLKTVCPVRFTVKTLADFIRHSRINLNVIDDTNYPAANMRFFEIPAAGGLQLSSACPEMQPYFSNRVDILYYDNPQEMIDQIKWALDNPSAVLEIRRSAYKKMQQEHSYTQRISELTRQLV